MASRPARYVTSCATSALWPVQYNTQYNIHHLSVESHWVRYGTSCATFAFNYCLYEERLQLHNGCNGFFISHNLGFAISLPLILIICISIFRYINRTKMYYSVTWIEQKLDVFVKHGCPQRQQSKILAKSRKSYPAPHPVACNVSEVWATLGWTKSPGLVTVWPPKL